MALRGGRPIESQGVEIIGWRTRDARYDWLSHELVKLTFAAFSTTALLGALLLFLLIGILREFRLVRWRNRRAPRSRRPGRDDVLG